MNILNANPKLSQSAQDFIDKNFIEFHPLSLDKSILNNQLVDGSELKVQDNEDIFILNFWATWCTPCKKELPDLDVLQKKLSAKAVKVIAIPYQDTIEKIQPFVKKINLDIKFIKTDHHKLHEYFQIQALPTTIFIDFRKQYYLTIIGQKQWHSKKYINFFQSLI